MNYDENGRLDYAKANNSIIHYEYDNTGRLIGVLSDLGRQGYQYKGSFVTAVTFQEKANDKKESEDMTIHIFKYNDHGQLIAEIDASGTEIDYKITSDSKSKMIAINQKGNSSKIDSFQYDNSLRPVKAKYADGTEASWSYPDKGGVVLELQGSNGEETRLIESADRHLRTVELGKGNTFIGEYDKAGRLTSITNNGHILLQQEWSQNGTLQVTKNESSAERMEYDSDGLVSRVLFTPPNEKGQFKNWQEMKLDNAGRPLEISDYLGLEMIMNYDNDGELAAMICKQDGKNYGFQINRDQSGSIQEVKSSWGTEHYTYDNGAIKKVEIEREDKISSIEWQSGKIQKLTQFDGGTIKMEYYTEPLHQGLLKEIQMPDSLRLSYEYDQQSRLKLVNVNDVCRMDLTYDNQGRLISLTQSPSSK